MINLESVDWALISHQELDLMLQICDNVDSELRNHLTPLCAACKINREDLVTVLLHHGAQSNKKCSLYNKLPLHFACAHSCGNLGIVRKLLEAGAHVDAQDWDGNAALHLACTESNTAVVELLIEWRADVHLADVDGETPLIRSCYAQSLELIDLLLKTGSDPNIRQGHPVEIAVLNSSLDALKLLVESGANVNLRSYLNRACEYNHIEMMKMLNSYGIDVNKSDMLSMTPLHTACQSPLSSEACVLLLLQWGAETNAKTDMGETALYYAIKSHSIGKIRLLLAYGADVNVCNLHFLFSMLSCFRKSSTTETCLQIFSLLLAAGIKLKLNTVDDLRSGIFMLQSSPAKTDLINLMKVHSSHPLSLQSLCRIGIRACMKSNKDINMRKLPVPSHMIRFLNFCDIVDEPTYS